jgi:hypothetical protein
VDGIAQQFGQPSNENVLPDIEGWLHKQGDKYKTWNKRWFVLKGSNLFYFKSPKVRCENEDINHTEEIYLFVVRISE